MSLTDQQIQEFKAVGYTTCPYVFTAREVDAMRAELARLRQAGAFRNVTTEGDGKTHSATRENLQICPLYNRSPLFRALAFHPKVLEMVPRLIGEPVVLRLDQVFLKPAHHGSGTSWHQDNAYFKIKDPMRGTAMWIAIHDATVANGTLHVLPGMQRENLEHGRDPMSDHHIRCWPDESRAVPVEMAAGGVVFFCYGTPHCTKANTTERERAGVAYHFITADAESADASPKNKGIGTVLTGAESTGGEREYGVKVAGTWEGEVEAALGAGAERKI